MLRNLPLFIGALMIVAAGMSMQDYVDPDAYWLHVERHDCEAGWHLTSVNYQTEEESGGRHHIDVMQPHDPAVNLVVTNGQETWQLLLDKPDGEGEPATHMAMWAGNTYSAWLDGGCSDGVYGMTMRGPDEDSAYQAHHVVYQLTFQWQEAVPPTPTPPLPIKLFLPTIRKD
jgi:hypothetical protein